MAAVEVGAVPAVAAATVVFVVAILLLEWEVSCVRVWLLYVVYVSFQWL